MKRIIWIVAALLLLSVPVSAFDIPPMKGRVNDYANLLTQEQVNKLAERLKSIETASGDGAQVVVLTVPSLAGDDIDHVRNNVFHDWKLGQVGKDNGVLLIIAPVERKIGIEVGYGLEPYLPDGATKRITEEKIKPHLRKGAENWYAAIDAGAAALAAPILAREKSAENHEPSHQKIFWVAVILAILSVLGIIILVLRRHDRREAARQEAMDASLKRSRDRRSSDLDNALRSGYFSPNEARRTARVSAVGAGVGAAAASPPPRRSSRSDDSPSYSSWGSSDSSSSSSSSSSDNSSSGGGGDSGGGGSSSDF